MPRRSATRPNGRSWYRKCSKGTATCPRPNANKEIEDKQEERRCNKVGYRKKTTKTGKKEQHKDCSATRPRSGAEEENAYLDGWLQALGIDPAIIEKRVQHRKKKQKEHSRPHKTQQKTRVQVLQLKSTCRKNNRKGSAQTNTQENKKGSQEKNNNRGDKRQVKRQTSRSANRIDSNSSEKKHIEQATQPSTYDERMQRIEQDMEILLHLIQRQIARNNTADRQPRAPAPRTIPF